MIQLNELKICDSCDNAFAKKLACKDINRCPACKTWKMDVESKN